MYGDICSRAAIELRKPEVCTAYTTTHFAVWVLNACHLVALLHVHIQTDQVQVHRLHIE